MWRKGGFSSNVSLLFLANLLNNGTVFLANMLIARNCAPETFGAFSVAVNVALMTLTVSEFGMNYSMIRLYQEHGSDAVKSRCVLLANLYFKVAVVGVLALSSLLASGPLARVLLNDAGAATLIGTALVSGGVLGVWSFFRCYFQVLGNFRAMALLTVSYALLRLLVLGPLLWRQDAASPEFLLLGVYILPLAAVLCISLISFGRRVSLAPPLAADFWDVGRDTLHYSKWVALTGISYSLIQQSLVFIVSSLGGVRQAALLGAGLVFTAVFSMVNDAVFQVLYPKVAAFSPEKLRDYRRRLLRLFPAFFLGATLVMALLSLLMVFCLGETYRASLAIFWTTGYAVGLTAYLGLYSMALHTLKRPQLAARVNLATLALFCVSAVLLMKFVSLQAVVLCYLVLLVSGELAKALLIDRCLARGDSLTPAPLPEGEGRGTTVSDSSHQLSLSLREGVGVREVSEGGEIGAVPTAPVREGCP